jgi:DNA repair protein SbcD/Mre11
MPQGRDINESGPKSVTLVTIADDRKVHVEERVTSLAQFERVDVDLSGIEDWKDMAGTVARALEQARGRAVSDHMVARLRITGATPLAWRLRRDIDLLKTEADDRAGLTGKCWVEKIEVDCKAPDMALASASHAASPVMELRRLIEEEVTGSEGYKAEIARIADELRGQLPPECRALLGADEEESRAVLAILVKEGAADVLARLHVGADEAEN